jgi:hypothetical protein
MNNLIKNEGMKKSVIFLACMLCAVVNLQAQYKINVQNGTKAEFYDNLVTAIENAVSGDTLYLPGTVIQVNTGSLTIDKKLSIIGAGWDVDSIGGLQTTEIKSGGDYVIIQFHESSSGSLLTGCMVQHVHFLQMVAGEPSAENITIWRNLLHGNLNLAAAGTPSVKNIVVRENNIGGSVTGNHRESNCMIHNNFAGTIYSIHSSYIFNNVTRGRIYTLVLCTVENNYIGDHTFWNNNTNCIFNNNAYIAEFTPVGSSSTFNNTLTGQSAAETFISPNADHPKRLVIKDDSPCKTGGAHGTEIGIYGGNTPYKPGAVPFHPHITQSAIAGQTDQFGNLRVNITVSAQSK